jgi:hypothetical protein
VTRCTSSIPDELLRELLRRKRILVIVDGLSELDDLTRRSLRPGGPDFPVAALIITSRLEEDLDSVPKTTVKTHRIRVFVKCWGWRISGGDLVSLLL